MDDIDVYRCREGRLNYMGLISLTLISVAMSCILLNETIGNLIIDHILPAAYSAIIILGKKLFDVSIFACIIPFCLVIGIMNYVAFVYRPVSTRYFQRKNAIRERQLDNGVYKNSHNAIFRTAIKSHGYLWTFSQYCRRFVIAIDHAVEYGIVNISDHQLRNYVAKKVAIDEKWCSMNMTSYSQGVIMMQGEREHFGERMVEARPNASTRTGMFSFKNFLYVPPELISRMMTSSGAQKGHCQDLRDTSTITNLISNSLPMLCGLFFSVSAPNAISTVNEPILVKLGFNSHVRKLNALIIFSTQDALERMRSQLAILSSMENGELLQVSIRDLCDEFGCIFETFYPDGVLMSITERIEACELFDEWLEVQSLPMRDVTDGTYTYQVPNISFTLFADWFAGDLMSVIHNTVGDRLIAHTMRFAHVVNMRVTSMKSPDQEDQISLSQSIYCGDTNMKSLNTVTLESLLVPRSSFNKQYTPVGETPINLHHNSCLKSDSAASSPSNDFADNTGLSMKNIFFEKLYPENDTAYFTRRDAIEDRTVALQNCYTEKNIDILPTESDLLLLEQFRLKQLAFGGLHQHYLKKDSDFLSTNDDVLLLAEYRLRHVVADKVVSSRDSESYQAVPPSRSRVDLTPPADGQSATLTNFLSKRYVSLCGQQTRGKSTKRVDAGQITMDNYLKQRYSSLSANYRDVGP